MNIIVVGCGKIGTTIISSLVAEGHNVVAIDSNPDIINEITNLYDAIGICGNGNDCESKTMGKPAFAVSKRNGRNGKSVFGKFTCKRVR